MLAVVLYHYTIIGPGAPFNTMLYWGRAAFRLGWSGVDLFFVLSGFLIGGILLDARNSPRYFRTFYARRGFRILPLYFLWLALISAGRLRLTRAGEFHISPRARKCTCDGRHIGFSCKR